MERNHRIRKRTIWVVLVLLVIVAVSIFAIMINLSKEEKPYSSVLQGRLSNIDSSIVKNSVRPDYLPAQMFVNLPQMPADFYQVRQLVGLGRLKIEDVGEEYWQQPEFFPHFEDLGLQILQNPPEDRWGAYGVAVYPADSVATINRGDELTFTFFVKSGYLVETYQGINLEVVIPENTSLVSGYTFSDGSNEVKQNPEVVKKYIDIEINPNLFILYPNFPVYNTNGTFKVEMKVSVDKNIPVGKYVIGLDTGDIPDEYHVEWTKRFLTLYTSGGLTKIDRPYYQAFIEVI